MRQQNVDPVVSASYASWTRPSRAHLAMPAFYDLFALDMQRVLNDEIVSSFDGLQPVPLDETNIRALSEHELGNPQATQGLYILHHRGEAVYVGKAEESLHDRLAAHRFKLGSRLNMDLAEIGFRCLYLDKNWSALTHERPLISRLGCRWNRSGFGNHDPGRNRDKTKLKPTHFDRQYPIDAGFPLEFDAGERSVSAALQEIRIRVPYFLRAQSKKGFRPARSHPEYHNTNVVFSDHETAMSALGKVVEALGDRWQSTFLYGYAILYREHYPYKGVSAFLRKIGRQDWIRPEVHADDAAPEEDDEDAAEA
jgi:hypothetical protein